MQGLWNIRKTMKAPSNPRPFDNRPIGVFDSGIGGLTVVKELMASLPGESIVYFGDTARIPYGTKSAHTIRRFALENSIFLLEHQVKMIVVACNTASATSLPFLQRVLNVPVIGVIEPGAEAAIQHTRNNRIGIIGTTTTVRSGAYHQAIQKRNSSIHITEQPCPLFVPLIEEGWLEDDVTHLVAQRYFQSLLANRVDTVILGCTHYPLLKPVFRSILGKNVALIDSGKETARVVARQLAKRGLLASPHRTPRHRFFISDYPHKFSEIGERFLQRPLPPVETVNFDEFLTGKGENFWSSFETMLQKTEKAIHEP